MEIKILNRSRLMQVLALLLCLLLVYAYAQLGLHMPQGLKAAIDRERGSIVTQNGTVLAKTVGDTRVYPQGSLAGQLVGMLGTDGGLEGLEHSYDDQLTHGQNVTISIDPTVQSVAESVLAKQIQAHQAEYGSMMAVEVKTGRILAAASYPPFDPGQWRRYSATERRNHPFLDVFEPGSVVKALVVAAALNEGTTTPDTLYDTPESRYVGGRWGHTIHDADVHPGRMDTRDILRYSSNVGMSHIVEKFSYQQLYSYLQNYGFGQSLQGFQLPTETGQLQPLNRWNDLVRATNAFGQGMSVSLVQLAGAYNALANDGMYVPPQLVLGEPQAPEHRVVSPEAARELRAMLKSAVDKQIFHAAGIRGYDMGGKTGTAQVVINGRYSDSVYSSTFAGFVPTDQPRVTLVVMVYGAKRDHFGSMLAAPIYRDVAAEMLSEWGMPPQTAADQQ